MAEFREFLSGWLTSRGWSANRLAEETGVAQTLLSRYLHADPRRRIQPTDRTLRRIAPVVGKSHTELMRMAGRLDTRRPRSPKPPSPRDYAVELADVARALLAIAERMAADQRLRPQVDGNPSSEVAPNQHYLYQALRHPKVLLFPTYAAA